MSLRLEDKWVWDFWFAVDGEDVHVFYLQAPRSLVDPERRHRNATIGHAVSRDLREWTVLPDALTPGAPGDFDDVATWTGSVLQHDGLWYMFYTGVSSAEDGYVQRVNFATSTDLTHWTKSGLPALEADPRFYEKLAGSTEIEESWRDPWVFEGPDGLFHMYVTARVPDGDGMGRGVVGHAVSSDLREWAAVAPVTTPGQWVGLEVPQLARIGGHWRLIYSTQARWISAARQSEPDAPRATGSYYMSSHSMFGPFEEDFSTSLLIDDELYSARAIHFGGQWYLLGFHGGHELEFVGALSDPLPLVVDELDRLVVRHRVELQA